MKLRSALILVFTLVNSVISQCTNPVQRKEVRDLSVTEKADFLNALVALKKEKSKIRTGYSTYDDYVRLHNDYASEAHGFPQFLPWHRRFIRNLEKDLTRVAKKTIILPYWDWSQEDAQNPEDSPMFDSDWFGGDGDPDDNYCIATGPFASLRTAFPRRNDCLRREFDQGDGTMSPFVSYRAITTTILSQTVFSEFCDRLEVAHGTTHVNIGGDEGDMTYIPLFFIHHVFIDMLWYNWQVNNADSSQYNGMRGRTRLRETDVMSPFGVTVKSVLSTQASSELCYTYPEYVSRISRASSAKVQSSEREEMSNSSLGGLAKVVDKLMAKKNPKKKSFKALRSGFIKMNNMDEVKVRKIEAEFKKSDKSLM